MGNVGIVEEAANSAAKLIPILAPLSCSETLICSLRFLFVAAMYYVSGLMIGAVK
jgi:hypothetical protein